MATRPMAVAVGSGVGPCGGVASQRVRLHDTIGAQRRIHRIFQPAAAFRGLPLTDVLREATENEQLSSYLQWVLGTAGRDVAPDVVPAAAALGQLTERGIEIRRSYVGEYCTSLEMAGASVTLVRLDDEISDLLADPAEIPIRLF
ncbi:dihydroxyacetone kinase subunit DhaK [Streptomyces sp. NBC_01717]|uniref:dihydroxyacetone kinase subunit DhaK n=1 Tax=Streptomyces sp. NBC_01717 TaxID=2975918 RepID=UPI002E2FD291|nr:dihydroxyacetone kinase subunit DhaK [Streptomyces sp. NBC_01717]